MKSIFMVVKAVHQHSGSSTWLEQRELNEFDTYEEAKDYIDSLTVEGDYQIAKVFRQSSGDAIKRQKEKIDREMEHVDKVAAIYAALRQAAIGKEPE